MSLSYELSEKKVAEITMDDGKANAMFTEWFEELNGLLDRAETDDAIAVLFSGRTGMFSGGLDVKRLASLEVSGWRGLIETFSATMLRVWCLPIPTVAAVTGHAVAGGCILASACDHAAALAGPYRFQMNEVMIGLPMPTWAAIICQDAWPIPQINDLLFLARPFSPEEVLELGVVREVVEDEAALVAAARAAAGSMAAIHRAPFGASKQRLRKARAEHAQAAIEGDFAEYSLGEGV